MLALEVVATTWAPRDFAICTAKEPTPPEAAWISAFCPAARFPIETIVSQAVMPASGIDAASICEIVFGFLAISTARTATYSA